MFTGWFEAVLVDYLYFFIDFLEVKVVFILVLQFSENNLWVG